MDALFPSAPNSLKSPFAAAALPVNYFANLIDAVVTKALIATDDSGLITVFNSAAEQLLGYRACDVVGCMTPLFFHLQEELDARADALSLACHRPITGFAVWTQHLNDKTCAEWDCRLKSQTGELKSVHLEVRAIRDGETTLGYLGVAAEINASGLDAVERIEQEGLLVKLAANVPGVLFQYRLTPEGRASFPYASEGIRTIYGLDAKAVRENAVTVLEMVHPEDVERVLESIFDSARTLKPWQAEYRVNLPDSSTIWVEGRAIPEREPDGCTLWHGVITEITSRKVVEEALRESEARFRTLFYSHSAVMLLVDPDEAVVLDANAAAEQFYGYPRETLVGMPMIDINTLNGSEQAQQRKLALERKCNSFVFKHRLASGEVRVVSVQASPIRWGGRVILFSIIHDITEQFEAAEALKVSEERYRLTIAAVRDGMWEWNLQSGVVMWDARCYEMLGYPPDAFALTLAQWQDLIHPDDYGPVMAEVLRRLGRKESFQCELRLKTATGEWLWIEVRGRVMGWEEGSPKLVVGTNTDITERHVVEAELKDANRKLEGLIGALPDAVVLKDGAGRWLVANQVAQRLFELEELDWAGQTNQALAAVLPKLADSFALMAQRDDEAWRGGGLTLQDETYCNARGEAREFETLRVPVSEHNGTAKALVVLLRDVTAEHASRRQIEELSQRNALLLMAAGEGIFGTDPTGRIVFANQAALILLGRAEHELQGHASHEFLDRREDGSDYPWEDCPIAQTLADQQPRHVENEWFWRKDGSGFPAGLTVTPLTEQGKLAGAVVVFQDTTLRRSDEQTLRMLQQWLSAVIENFQAAVLLEDEERRVVLVNQRFCDLCDLPMPPPAMQGMDRREIAQDAKRFFVQPERFIERLEEVIEKRELVVGEEWSMVDGRALERDYVPIKVDGVYRGHLWIYHDVTERKMQEIELRKLATTDPLTGLPNRRYFVERLEQEFTRFQRYGQPTAVLMLDIDHFKRVNDTHGHAVGDQVLKRFALVCQRLVRRSDVLGRLGGEEFAVLLPCCDLEAAVELAERIRQAVSVLSPDEDEAVNITVSIGVAVFDPAIKSVDAVLGLADRALYSAKQAGRDRVVVDEG